MRTSSQNPLPASLLRRGGCSRRARNPPSRGISPTQPLASPPSACRWKLPAGAGRWISSATTAFSAAASVCRIPGMPRRSSASSMLSARASRRRGPGRGRWAMSGGRPQRRSSWGAPVPLEGRLVRSPGTTSGRSRGMPSGRFPPCTCGTGGSGAASRSWSCAGAGRPRLMRHLSRKLRLCTSSDHCGCIACVPEVIIGSLASQQTFQNFLGVRELFEVSRSISRMSSGAPAEFHS
eukprot:jgi/Botrbrau1/11181/Bobra.0214s0007.1